MNSDNPDVTAASAGARGPLDNREPVLLFNAASEEEADVVRATLEAAGIKATLTNAHLNSGAGMLAETVGNTPFNGVYVSQSDLEAARAVLAAPPPTDEELEAEEAADPTTLEDAEERVRRL